MATVIGVGFAFAALRVKGLYLALSTLALQFVMDWVISHAPAISGGVSATLQAPAMALLGQTIESDSGLYYVALGWALLVTLFMLNLRRTALGRALVAVREKDYAAAVIGVQAFRYKLVAFATSSFIGGVSGAMLIFCFYHAVTPEQFAVNVLIELLAYADRRRAGQHHRQLVRRGLHPAAAGADPHADRLGRQAAGRGHRHRDAVAPALCGVWRADHHLPAGGTDGPGKLYGNVRTYLMVWPFGYARKLNMSAVADAILTLNNIEVIYDRVALAIKGASIAVPQGGMVALLGANGAGKSTLLKAVSGLLKAERGEVTRGELHFLGENIDALPPQTRVRRGIVQVLEGGACSST